MCVSLTVNHNRKVSRCILLGLTCKLCCFQVLVCAPIDLVKVRLQGQTTAARYRGPIHCVAVILKEDGPRGLLRGGAALALRDIPCYGLYFLPYELIRYGLTETGQQPGQFPERQCSCVCPFPDRLSEIPRNFGEPIKICWHLNK